MEEQQSISRTVAELTFWPLCPYCFHAHEYGKAYEECCLRCTNCRRGFRVAAVPAQPEAEQYNGAGGGYYNCRMGAFPLRYVWCARERGKEEEEEMDVGVLLGGDIVGRGGRVGERGLHRHETVAT